MERHLAVILAADVVGYSRLMEQDEAGTFERLRTYRKDLFEPEIAMRHGRIFKLMGDGLLAEFPSAIDAVECAVVLQRSMAERNRSVDADRRVDIRIGINLGEVIVEGDDRYGEGVNIAARIQELTEPGGICVSGKVAAEVKKKLAVGLEPMGDQRVKNIDEPITLFRVRLDKDPGRPASAGRGWGAKEWFRAAAIGAVVFLGAVGVTLSAVNRWRGDGLAPFDKPSIAVLPFGNLSNDPKWQPLADAVTEDITTNLSQSRDLFVIARNSGDVYKGKAVDVRQVGRDLGVRYVLEGSVNVIDDKLRVTAQLIEAASNNHVWSQRYEGGVKDVAGMQDDVTRKIAGTLVGYEGVIAEADRAKALRKPPANLQAYELYLLAMASKHRETKQDNIRAIELFHKAIEMDPNFTRAYVGLSWAYAYEGGTLGYTESFARTASDLRAAAEKAVALDPYDAEAHLAMGVAYGFGGEPDRASTEYDLALSMAPNNADLLMIYAWDCPSRCTPERGVELVERALRLNPTYPAWYNRPALQTYYFGGEFVKALDAAQKVQNPGVLENVLLAAVYAQLGRTAEAAKVAASVRQLAPGFAAETQPWFSFARDEDRQLFVGGVRKAGLAICGKPADLKAHPEITPLQECAVARPAT